MEREPVDSTCISSAGHSTADQDLQIEFTDNTVYTYHNITGHQFVRMLRSPSPGWYFNKYIRNSYSFSRDF